MSHFLKLKLNEKNKISWKKHEYIYNPYSFSFFTATNGPMCEHKQVINMPNQLSVAAKVNQ